jgi:hypothetical protein
MKKEPKNKLSLLTVLVVLLLPTLYIGIKYLRKKSPLLQPQSIIIESIDYSIDCKVNVKISSGENVAIDITDKVISKKCLDSPEPVISTDGKYAVFELQLLIKEADYMKYGTADHTLYAYLLSKKDWIVLHEYGAAKAVGVTISPENIVTLDLSYEGELLPGDSEYDLTKIENNY